MYQRGRPGRERSRDPSRPFSRGGDRDRNYDSRFRRDEQRGHWDDHDRDRDRREERRRDERPHPSLPPLPPPVVSPVGPPVHLPELSNFAPSKGPPNARRESRDGPREPLPVEAARRHSGGSSSLSLRKEYSEPSPRERGMIGDHQAPPPSRRQISGSSWTRDRDDDRDRIDTARSRKNSLERNPDNIPRSPITESPRNLLPASPDTSISAATSTAAGMAPAAPLSGSATGTEKNPLARVFQEASYAYIKFLDAQSNWKVADKERSDHIEHFNTFPVLKERYEGTARIARKELQSAAEILSKKSSALDQLCSGLIEDRLSKRESESAVEFCDKIKRELGSSSTLAQFVRANIPPPVALPPPPPPPPPPPAPAPAPAPAQVPAPTKDEFIQLRGELRDMKRRQQDEEKTRQTFAKEFQTYKNEQEAKLKTQDAKLTGFQLVQSGLKADIERVKDDNRKTADELKKMQLLVTATRTSVSKLEAKDDGDVVMVDAVSEGALNEVRKTLEELQKTVTAGQKRLLETSTKCRDIDATMIRVKGETETLQQKISRLEISGNPRNTGPGVTPADGPNNTPHRDCATKADIEQLVLNIKNQDELLDTFRSGAEKDTSDILEEIQGLDQKMETHVQTTDQKIQDLGAGMEAHTQMTGEMIHDLEQKTTSQITALATEQETLHTKTRADVKEIDDNFGRHYASFDTKFQNDVERLQKKLVHVENHLESHVLAITHQEQRMNSFTTKDFYERVVANLIQINPLLFNYTNQLQLCNGEIKALKDNVRVIATQFEAVRQRVAIISPLPRAAIHDGSSMDLSANGNGRSDISEGPASSLNAILRDLELHSDQIKKLDQRISDHIETYVAKMDDIKEWTVSCTLRLAENTASAAHIMDDVGKLRAYLMSAQGPESPHIPTAVPGVGRWRVVSNISEQMQGLSDENEAG